MPQLPTANEVDRFYLPSSMKDESGEPTPESEWGWVVMEVGEVSAGDLSLVKANEKSEIEVSFAILAHRIREWNIMDGVDPISQNPIAAEISVDNIKRLDVEDFGYLAAKMKGEKVGAAPMSETEKKT